MQNRIYFSEDGDSEGDSEVSFFNISYSLRWQTNKSEKLLSGDVEVKLKKLLNEKALSLSIKIKKLIILKENKVILNVCAMPSHSPYFIVTQLKEYTDRAIRIAVPDFDHNRSYIWSKHHSIDSYAATREDP